MAALELLAQLHAHGGTLVVTGPGAAKVRAPHPLPDSFMTQLRDAKPALLSIVGAVPAPWVRGVVQLMTMRAPTGVALWRWQDIVTDACVFLEGWGAQAAHLGWTELDLFGVHPVKPVERVDVAGLVPLLHRAEIVAMSELTARVRTRSGKDQTFRRRLCFGAVPVWALEVP